MVRRMVPLVVALALTAALAACGGGEASVRDVDIDAAAALYDERAGDDGFVVLDVRTPEEFAAGHLEGAVNLNVEDPAFDSKAAELDQDAEYLVYCRSGNRSAQATAVLEELGFDDIATVVGGGFAELAAAGAPVG